MKKIRNMKGFTLIELMIVITIIAILAAIMIPNIGGLLNRDKYAPQQMEVITQEQEKSMNLPVEKESKETNNKL